nr:centromere/kinetochore protein zw10 homolog isoform X1 [Ipomoea batatas]
MLGNYVREYVGAYSGEYTTVLTLLCLNLITDQLRDVSLRVAMLALSFRVCRSSHLIAAHSSVLEIVSLLAGLKESCSSRRQNLASSEAALTLFVVLEEIELAVVLLDLTHFSLDALDIFYSIPERLKRIEIYSAPSLETFKSADEIKISSACSIHRDGYGRGCVKYLLTRVLSEHLSDQLSDLLLGNWSLLVDTEVDNDIKKVRYNTRASFEIIHEIELPTILKAMEAIGIMDYGLAKIADSMIKTIVTPVVVNWSTTTFHVEEKTKESGHCADSVLRIVSSTDHKIDCSSGEAMYSTLIQIVKFINESLCFQNDAWMHCFGRLTWPRMSELIISNFLSKLVPDDASKLADFQKLVKHTSEFETILKDLKFISSDSKDERLSRFADNVEVHFASRKKVEILTKARNVLLQSDFRFREDSVKGTQVKDEENGNTTRDHVVDLLFSSEKCMVSEAALQLMKLVHQTLKDVCLSSPRVGVEFYQAARDSLLLYEAILPVKLEKQLDSINHAAVLIHNDCLYLSQEILGLAFEYRSNFPSFIKELAVFVDLAPRFQMMAEEVLQRQIQLVIVNLKQAIDGADGFQNTHLVKHYESAKLSIDQVVFILEKVHIVWKSLMLPSTYKRSMSMFLEEIFSRISKDILLLDDMAAEETLQLQSLIHLLFENLQPFLEFLLDLIQREKLRDYPIQTIDDLIPSLRKLKKLADLLDMPLKSITESWESGELVICGFTSSEVQDFIRAIFTQSTLRKECLHRIESTAFG